VYVLIEFEEKHEVAPPLENKLIMYSCAVWWLVVGSWTCLQQHFMDGIFFPVEREILL
jgi:hypothetical protein